MSVTEPRRKRIASFFRYCIADHEAMANTYPRVLERLSDRYEVHHFSFRSRAPHRLHKHPGIHMHEIPLYLRRGSETDKWFKTALWLLFAPFFGLWLRAKKTDLVYIEETLPVFPAVIRVFSGRPVLESMADIFWDMYLGKRGPAGIARKLLLSSSYRSWRRLRGLIARTEAFKDFAVSVGVDPGRIRVVTESCEPHIFFPMDMTAARRGTPFRDGQVVLINHGVIHPNKALDRVLRFLAPFIGRHPDFLFAVTGSGPARAALERLAARLGIEKQVLFTGWLPDAESVNRHLNAADMVLVMRSGRFSDHFQVTASMLHGLSCGRAVLAARLKGIQETIEDGKNGVLFDPNDAEEFRRKLKMLVDDPGLRATLGSEALRTARGKLGPETVTEQWAEAIASFVE